MAKKKSKYVSIRGDTYHKLKEEADVLEISVPRLLEHIINKGMRKLEAPEPASAPPASDPGPLSLTGGAKF